MNNIYVFLALIMSAGTAHSMLLNRTVIPGAWVTELTCSTDVRKNSITFVTSGNEIRTLPIDEMACTGLMASGYGIIRCDDITGNITIMDNSIYGHAGPSVFSVDNLVRRPQACSNGRGIVTNG